MPESWIVGLIVFACGLWAALVQPRREPPHPWDWHDAFPDRP